MKLLLLLLLLALVLLLLLHCVDISGLTFLIGVLCCMKNIA